MGLFVALCVVEEVGAKRRRGGVQEDFDRLNLNARPMMEKSVEFLNDCLEEILVEQQKVSYHHRNVARQQQQLAQWQQKRRQENNQRRSFPPLPPSLSPSSPSISCVRISVSMQFH